jgi:hypothetical protein
VPSHRRWVAGAGGATGRRGDVGTLNLFNPGKALCDPEE